MTATACASELLVRRYEERDRTRVRDIACRTAFRNRGHSVMIDDAALFADYWTSYYTDIEPESASVAVVDGEIVGYCLGCVDTRRFQKSMTRTIGPRIARALLRRLVSRAYRQDAQLRRMVRWLATHSWREAPSVDLDRFPAHYHLNVERRGYGTGAYTALALAFVEHAKAQGSLGVHGQVLDRRDGGVWDGMVQAFEAAHPEVSVVATSCPSTMGAALWGDTRPMLNRAFGTDIDGYATFLHWLRRWRRL